MIWKVFKTTLSGKNQMTAPAQLCRALGWKKGDRLLFSVVDGDSFKVVRLEDRKAPSTR